MKRNVAAANAFKLIKILSNPWFAHRKQFGQKVVFEQLRCPFWQRHLKAEPRAG
jgi:hypothetical protein